MQGDLLLPWITLQQTILESSYTEADYVQSEKEGLSVCLLEGLSVILWIKGSSYTHQGMENQV